MKHPIPDHSPLRDQYRAVAGQAPKHVALSVADGVATVTLPGGGVIQARGTATVGQRVFVCNGAIEGPAPALTYVEGEA